MLKQELSTTRRELEKKSSSFGSGAQPTSPFGRRRTCVAEAPREEEDDFDEDDFDDDFDDDFEDDFEDDSDEDLDQDLDEEAPEGEEGCGLDEKESEDED
jgi:hypothetical protein